jgi:hypothetical protein
LNSSPLGARGMVWVVWGIITHGGRAKRTGRQAGRQAGRQTDFEVVCETTKILSVCPSVCPHKGNHEARGRALKDKIR